MYIHIVLKHSEDAKPFEVMTYPADTVNIKNIHHTIKTILLRYQNSSGKVSTLSNNWMIYDYIKVLDGYRIEVVC